MVHSKRVDQSQQTLEKFAIVLVSHASAQLFPDNTHLLYKLFAGATESGGAM